MDVLEVTSCDLKILGRPPLAILVNIEIMRVFVRLRLLLATHEELAGKLAVLERKYDAQFQVVFDVIQKLIQPEFQPKRRIGFQAKQCWCGATRLGSTVGSAADFCLPNGIMLTFHKHVISMPRQRECERSISLIVRA